MKTVPKIELAAKISKHPCRSITSISSGNNLVHANDINVRKKMHIVKPIVRIYGYKNRVN